jgi:hypothetical protein
LCDVNPCQHGGTCIIQEKARDQLCLCPYGRGGALCNEGNNINNYVIEGSNPSMKYAHIFKYFKLKGLLNMKISSLVHYLSVHIMLQRKEQPLINLTNFTCLLYPYDISSNSPKGYFRVMNLFALIDKPRVVIKANACKGNIHWKCSSNYLDTGVIVITITTKGLFGKSRRIFKYDVSKWNRFQCHLTLAYL